MKASEKERKEQEAKRGVLGASLCSYSKAAIAPSFGRFGLATFARPSGWCRAHDKNT